MIKCIFVVAILSLNSWSLAQDDNRGPKQHPELTLLVRNWAQKLGMELWHFGEMVTRRSKVEDSFKDTTIFREDAKQLLRDVHEKISTMMKQKVKAVERIMDIAEQAALAQKDDDVDKNFQFYSAKNLTNSAEETNLPQVKELMLDNTIKQKHFKDNYKSMVQPGEVGYQKDEDTEDDISTIDEIIDSPNGFKLPDDGEKDPLASQVPIMDKLTLPLYRNKHFYNIPVNTNHSAVHIPSNVYERSKNILSGIIWSEELDKTFKNNYKDDPTLSWQYFGSSTGFMRQFPAMVWSQEPIDLFDCRTRSWYIEAASSPKDIIILVDRSGSMTGMRREIARHVVHNILDTLGNNDYVNIYTFSNTTEPLVECYQDALVQANLANVRVFKESMNLFKTEQIANFSLALITAFELLQDFREKGACCNQAIMLVTDGVQYNYKEIFEEYNWQNLPNMNVRVFTYLIGREVSNVREVKWMACANQGYYVHLSTYAEVREEVLQYVPVMARPMVLSGTKPNPSWSPVYADVADPKLTNWLWVNRERNKQRERFLAYRKNKAFLSKDMQDKKFVHQQKNVQDNYGELQTYHLMTSVSLPVYDKRTRQERVANLLGVAGTDVPIEYIQKLMLPHRLGVNAHGFIVTNNGYILCHPDLRPVFEGILKPAYNRVDMLEVEIENNGNDVDPRNFTDEIREFRRKVVKQIEQKEKEILTFKIKTHLDEMRRIFINHRHYYYKGIQDTPFTLVLSLPDKYGSYHVRHPVEIDVHRLKISDNRGSLTDFFTGNWSIHPDWHYCRYLDKSHEFDTPEQEFKHFLKRIDEPMWKWDLWPVAECDRKLVTKLVADAKITSWFDQNITTTSKQETGPEFIRRFKIIIAFMATHSGLTRYQSFPQNLNRDRINENDKTTHFHIIHNKAIDEVWYRRAVESHYIDPINYVYSVPFHIDADEETLVTVSHGIFRKDKGSKAPAAVVGYQFYHSALYEFFMNTTQKCGENIPCKRTCDSKELHCLLIDDNGYVIVSNEPGNTGQFFGHLRPDIMKQLLNEQIYKVTRMFDYQGLCPEGPETTSPATTLLTPLSQVMQIIHWFITTTLLYTKTILGNEIYIPLYNVSPSSNIENEHHMESEYEDHEEKVNEMPPSKFNEKEFDQRLLIKKTKPEPCDNEMWIYSLVNENYSEAAYNMSFRDCVRPFVVQPVANSNMILLVINNLCMRHDEEIIPDPEPTQFNYNMSLHCYRLEHDKFVRRHYMTCINKNVNESEIKLCGSGTNMLSIVYLVISLVVLIIRL